MIRKVKSNVAILSIISISLLVSLTVWFSANAISSQITLLWMLNEYDIALLSMILIIGFVVGGLVSAIFNLPDTIKTMNFYSLYAGLSALTNFLAIFSPNFIVFLVLG